MIGPAPAGTIIPGADAGTVDSTVAGTEATVTVAIVGTGRLGRALGGVIARQGHRVLGYDPDPAATAMAAAVGIEAVSLDTVRRESSIILLTVPPQTVLPIAGQLHRDEGPQVISLSSVALEEASAPARPPLPSARPLAQYRSVAAGIPWTLVCSDETVAAVLRPLLPEHVTLTVDTRQDVSLINRIATLEALRACRQVERQLRDLGVSPAAIAPAIRNVLAGTALDFPPEPDNGYTRRLLSELEAGA